MEQLQGKKVLTTSERIISIVMLIIMFVTIWFMVELVIVTFILTFVFYHLHKYVLNALRKTALKKIPSPFVLALVYAGVIALFAAFIVQNVNMIVSQIMEIVSLFTTINIESLVAQIDPGLLLLIQNIDISEYIWQAGQAIASGLANMGSSVLNFIIALIVSFLIVLEKGKFAAIGNSIKVSRIAFIYYYIEKFFSKFIRSFGRFLKVQAVIAAFNAVVLMVYMLISGFPYIIVLTLMVFLTSLIPFLGAILQSIPLVIVALTFGGLPKAVEFLIMMVCLQTLEAYFINPKIMSYSMSLPVSLVLPVILISERYLGAWGMLIGIPFFIFVMDALNIDYSGSMKPKKLIRH